MIPETLKRNSRLELTGQDSTKFQELVNHRAFIEWCRKPEDRPLSSVEMHSPKWEPTIKNIIFGFLP